MKRLINTYVCYSEKIEALNGFNLVDFYTLKSLNTRFSLALSLARRTEVILALNERSTLQSL